MNDLQIPLIKLIELLGKTNVQSAKTLKDIIKYESCDLEYITKLRDRLRELGNQVDYVEGRLTHLLNTDIDFEDGFNDNVNHEEVDELKRDKVARIIENKCFYNHDDIFVNIDNSRRIVMVKVNPSSSTVSVYNEELNTFNPPVKTNVSHILKTWQPAGSFMVDNKL